jgi:hypothetical protein
MFNDGTEYTRDDADDTDDPCDDCSSVASDYDADDTDDASASGSECEELESSSDSLQLLAGEDATTSPSSFLSRSTARELAHNLTAIDIKLFLAIQPVELWHAVRHAKDKKTLAPNVVANITWFNQLSYWVSYSICSCTSAEQRVRLVSYLISVARVCIIDIDALNSTGRPSDRFRSLTDSIAALHHRNVGFWQIIILLPPSWVV